MISAIIFDFGGVVATNPIVTASYEYAKILGIGREKIFSVISNKERTLGPYQENKITEDDYWTRVESELGIDNSKREELRRIMLDSSKPDKNVLDLVEKLRTKYKIGLLSDTEREWFEYWRKLYNYDSYFHEIVTSYEVGARKNVKAPFLRILDKLGISVENADETVLVDDKKENADIAEKEVGMKIIIYSSCEQLKYDLGYLLVG